MGRNFVKESGKLVKTTLHRVRQDEFYQIVSAQIVVWGFLDPVSSFAAMTAYGGTANEANPVVRNLLETNPNLMVVVKLFALIAVVIIAIEGEEYIQSFKYWRAWMHALLWLGLFVVLKNFFAAFIAIS